MLSFQANRVCPLRIINTWVSNDYRHTTGVDFEPNEHAADGVTAGQAQHNSSNVGGVTAGHVGHNSSTHNKT